MAKLCNKCTRKAVSETPLLCKEHFLPYLEIKVFKTIKKYNLLKKEDKLCVAASGGKDSLTLLYLLRKFCKEQNISMFALAIDEGIENYRDKTLNDLEKFCKDYEIELKTVSFKNRYGLPLDELRKKSDKKPCTVCGVFRRTLLNRESRKLGATKLATGHNLDDECQSLVMNIIKGNMGHNAALGPVSGLNQNDKFVQRIKPLYFISEKETRLYCILKGFNVKFSECPNISESFRAEVRDTVNDIEAKTPGAKNGIVKSFLEIMPLLKENYRKNRPFKNCEKCKDPSSGKICNACRMEEELCPAN